MSLEFPVSIQVSDKVSVLKDRSEMFFQARNFFRERGVLEVDCPAMGEYAFIDVNIDLIRAYCQTSKTLYLHPTPEYGMKRLLSEGIGDIYQLSHVFRDNESSVRHNPEFTMVEWYRLKFPFSAMIEETIDFIRMFIGDVPATKITYRNLLKKYVGIDYLTVTQEDLLQYLVKKGIEPYHNINEEGKDGFLNLILGTEIIPQLGQNELCVLTHFPASQAALARTKYRGDEEVAERFEIFYRGLELANGYHELTNYHEHKERLICSNTTRERLGKDTLPIDHSFLEALEKGLPDCCGVSIGFDRLMMLRHHKDDIADVIPLSEK